MTERDPLMEQAIAATARLRNVPKCPDHGDMPGIGGCSCMVLKAWRGVEAEYPDLSDPTGNNGNDDDDSRPLRAESAD